MGQLISANDRINQALQPESLGLPPGPRVVRVDWELDEDSSGEESLEILVLFDPRTTDDDIRAAPIHEIKWRIVESLRRHSVTQSPYFTFEREGERAALSEDDWWPTSSIANCCSRRTARLDARRPQQANLRRAVSAAYYALFHQLVHEACRQVMGTGRERRPFRALLARAFQHGDMLETCKAFASASLGPHVRRRLPAGFQIPVELQKIALTFKEAQQKRHLADYDPSEQFTRGAVLAFIRDVDEAMELLHAIRDRLEVRFFLLLARSAHVDREKRKLTREPWRRGVLCE
jgi:hypothetical protein